MNADQLKAAMAALPPPVTTALPPYWDYWRMELYERVLADDPRRFYEWPCIYHTMLQAHWPLSIEYELGFLDWQRWQYALQVPHFGPPDYLSPNTNLSMNLIHQAYHLMRWETATGKRIETLNTIVEFGGGYGAMALLCRRMGFEGRYIIYDLPEFSLLQEYYLSQFGMLDKMEWNPVKKPQNVDLFMALYSMSEVPLNERRGLMLRANSYLFLYSGRWEGWDNVEWFKQLSIASPLKWRHSEIHHLPNKGGDWYSIGY